MLIIEPIPKNVFVDVGESLHKRFCGCQASSIANRNGRLGWKRLGGVVNMMGGTGCGALNGVMSARPSDELAPK
ncbi:hypothetical protein RCH12_003329 [Cryobacterium sp. MP_3.1]|uniref:hypothetical protein n=1 Tax=Cryobacterium sp. MP_3.1 TaxID=3071711 RepID=UPI002DFAA50C|nr:hypothetical protein [Cryobacterium sp. MP_3.1]